MSAAQVSDIADIMDRARPLNLLPDELWCLVLSNLTMRDSICCERVCRKFYDLLNRSIPLRHGDYGSWSHVTAWAYIKITINQLLWSDVAPSQRDSKTPATRSALIDLQRGCLAFCKPALRWET